MIRPVYVSDVLTRMGIPQEEEKNKGKKLSYSGVIQAMREAEQEKVIDWDRLVESRGWQQGMLADAKLHGVMGWLAFLYTAYIMLLEKEQ